VKLIPEQEYRAEFKEQAVKHAQAGSGESELAATGQAVRTGGRRAFS
jgi:hypothetical protein